MKLLVLSNGHGEDKIAARIIEQLQFVTNQLELTALPIVGEGYAYGKLNIPIAGKVQQMPSGGFIYKGGNPLWQDLKGGLIGLTLEQIRVVRQWGKDGGVVLAVGDIVPLLYAWWSGANYAFVGTAKSEYYLRDDTGWLNQTSWVERQVASVYMPWERWLMNRSACKGVFPRDSLTTEILQQWSIPAYDLGNPMMDGGNRHAREIIKEENTLHILLLPGSRMSEALNNWQQILVSVKDIISNLSSQKLRFLGAIAPALELQPFKESAINQGWQRKEIKQHSQTVLELGNSSLILSQDSFEEFIQQGDIAVAMAGTGTEEYVGLGKPAVIMPGKGPQFTYAFAEAQSRLLGCSVTMVNHPQQIGEAISRIISDRQLLKEIDLNGRRRMGESGASRRIAECIWEKLLAKV